MKKKPIRKDENEIAASIISQIKEAAIEHPTKNPAAVALVRMCGKKGGRARADKLTAEQRKAIARKAANDRWKKSKGTS